MQREQKKSKQGKIITLLIFSSSSILYLTPTGRNSGLKVPQRCEGFFSEEGQEWIQEKSDRFLISVPKGFKGVLEVYSSREFISFNLKCHFLGFHVTLTGIFHSNLGIFIYF